MKKYQEALKAFQAIADGEKWEIAGTGYLVVRNPDFQEDNGSNPNLVVEFMHDNVELFNV